MNSNQQARPFMLKALCILTFTGSSVAFVGYFFASLFFERTSELIIKYSSWQSTEAISPVYFNVLMVLFALSLTGAIRMWKQHVDGFILYLFSQLIILFLPAVWVNWQAFSTTNLIFTLVFTAGYAIHLKLMK
jgi:hypothetical protein